MKKQNGNRGKVQKVMTLVLAVCLFTSLAMQGSWTEGIFSMSETGEQIIENEPENIPETAEASQPEAEAAPEAVQTPQPAAEPTPMPTSEPTPQPTVEPTLQPTAEPSAEPTPQSAAEAEAEVTPQPTVTPIDENEKIGLCPHHPVHDQQCGYIPFDPEHLCTYHCEICDPTPVSISAGLGKTVEAGQTLNLAELVSFDPSSDTQDHHHSIRIRIENDRNEIQDVSSSGWTPQKAGTYTLIYTAEKTVDGQKVECGSLKHVVTVKEAKTVISEVKLTLDQSVEYGQKAEPLTQREMKAGWKAEGTWEFEDGQDHDTFPEGKAVLHVVIHPEDKFCFLDSTAVTVNDAVQSVTFQNDGTISFTKEYNVEKPAVSVISEQSYTVDEHLTLIVSGEIPEGSTLKGELLDRISADSVCSLDIYFTDNELRRIDAPLEKPLQVTALSDYFVSDQYSVYSLGHPQRMLLSETPLQSTAQKGSVNFSLDNPGVYDLRSDILIEVDLPENGFVNQPVDLVNNLRVAPQQHQGKTVKARLSDVTILGNVEFSWDGNTTLIPTRPGTYRLIYEAYTEENGVETILSRTEIQFLVQGDRPVGEFLDGDYAYISDAGMLQDDRTESKTAIRTGSAPWDRDDQPGNDTTDLNNSLRSYDIASYTVYFKSKVRDSAPCSAYKEGRLFFEFLVPGDHQHVQFETESMGWLSAKKDIHYEVGETMYQGAPAQLLRGSYIWEPGTNNPTAIGESYQELGIVIRALNMVEKETIQPHFNFWLEHNEVVSDVNENHIPTGALVTDSTHQCSKHKEVEYKGFAAPEIYVTSRLNLNVSFVNGYYTQNQVLGEFDFNTGNEDAFNKGKGVKEGRIIGYGANLQVVSKGNGQGLRGVQFPDGRPITFDINISNAYLGDSGVSHSTAGFEPLVWSADENTDSRQTKNGRQLNDLHQAMVITIPKNRKTVNYPDPRSCLDGGNWDVVMSEDGKTLHVTVSDYKFDLSSIRSFPSMIPASSDGNYVYYNPEQVKNYWDIPTACFSTGRFYVVQPFYNEQGEYIVDKFNDSGTFQVNLSDSDLMASYEDGEGNRLYLDRVSDNSNQPIQNDDKANYNCWLSSPGNITGTVYYNRYDDPKWNTSLTDGCFDNGKDWLMRGDNLSIEHRVSHINAEAMNQNVAVDELVKFDDAFFELEWVLVNNNGVTLYGAKPDGTGWDHQGLEPDDPGYDDEMKAATVDDLVFYSSLEALKADGKVPVAVLQEYRNATTSQQYQPDGRLYGHTKNDPDLDGHVFMVLISARSWNRADVAASAKQYLNKETLTTEDYQRYMNEAFPSRGDRPGEQMSYDEYPDQPFWIYEPETEPGLKHYAKSIYDENGYVTGTSGNIYGDSCLVIGHRTLVEKKVAQVIEGTDTEKKAYDMDVNQRVADYVIQGKIQRTKVPSMTDTEIQDVVHIRDILPKGLSYIPGSSYLGGTYIQTGNGKQGNVEGGIQLDEPIMKDNPDGTVTLEWIIPDVTVTNQEFTYLPPLYYSCDIGTPGNEETDVQNNQSLLNTVMIWSEGEQKKDFNTVNQNVADCSILVSKNRAVSISKRADQAVVEKKEPMGFVMNVGNNGQNEMNVIAVDSLPYVGDAGHSSFTGECQVTELSLITDTPQELQKILNDNFRFYYTNDETLRGKGSQDFTESDFKAPQWREMYVSSQGKIYIPRSGFAPVAVAAVGKLPGGMTLKAHITLLLPEGKPGDYVANRLTRSDMESYARSYIVSRTLEGLVWKDKDANGLQSYTEEKISEEVQVNLLKLKEYGDPENRADYVPYRSNGRKVSVKLGSQYNLTENSTTEYQPGEYRFVNLPEGIFAVEFTHSGALDGYRVTLKDQGSDDTIDSDAQAQYSPQGQLESGFILNIRMPAKEDIRSMTYASLHHDMGIYSDGEFSFTKVKAENTQSPLSGAEFKLYLRQPGCSDDLIDVGNPGNWKLIDTQVSGKDGRICFDQLLPGEYRLVETKAPQGRLLPKGQWSVHVVAGQPIDTPQAVGEQLPPAFAVKKGKLLLANMNPATVPHSGGTGTRIFGLISAVLIGIGAAVVVKANRKKHNV